MPRPVNNNSNRMSSLDSDNGDQLPSSSITPNGEQDSDTPNHFINSDDGLKFSAMDDANTQSRLLHALQHQLSTDTIQTTSSEDNDNDSDSNYGQEFPTTILVTGFDNEFFDDDELKKIFEITFSSFGSDAIFFYFRSFKRVRVSYGSAASAVEARLKMHLRLFEGYVLKCYFGQVLKKRTGDKDDGFLHPPTPDKQFLISPPASPPVDWEPCPEHHPILDYDLVAALAKLGPGDTHELHKPESESHPSIVVQIATDDYSCDKDNNGGGGGGGVKIIQTKRPDIISPSSATE